MNLSKIRALTRWLMHRVPPPEGRAGHWSEVSLLLTDDEGMIPLNEAYFDKSTPTDVISLHYAPMPGEDGWSGEVVVNVERAMQEGQRRGSVTHELALYIAHGCQHLGGASDHTPLLRARMRRKELGWLTEAQARGHLANLLREESIPV